MIVMKFGGTALAGGQHFARAVEIIALRRERRPVVVVSAMADTTDELLRAAQLVREGDLAGSRAAIEELCCRHDATAAEAIPAGSLREATRETLRAEYAKLIRMLGRLNVLKNGDLSVLDAILATGETWSAAILARALQARGLGGVWVDSHDVVITDDTFGRAIPDPWLLADRARCSLAGAVWEGKIPVIQGFVGATRDGVTTTMGRGTSDYTAALIGQALDAEVIEIWTDVDGLMSADPRVVSGARTLAEASYDEATALAFFGAQVLHAATVGAVVDRGIPVWIKNSERPRSAGTWIGPRLARSPGIVKSVALKRGVTTITLRTSRIVDTPEFLRKTFQVLARHRVVMEVMATSELSVSLTIEPNVDTSALIEDLEALGTVTVYPDRAIVTVVGDGLRDTPGIGKRILKALGSVNVEMISQGASRVSVAMVVQNPCAEEVVCRLHDEFFPR